MLKASQNLTNLAAFTDAFISRAPISNDKFGKYLTYSSCTKTGEVKQADKCWVQRRKVKEAVDKGTVQKSNCGYKNSELKNNEV